MAGLSHEVVNRAELVASQFENNSVFSKNSTKNFKFLRENCFHLLIIDLLN